MHLFAGLSVKDFAAARPWYEQLFGEPSFLPHATEAVWMLAEERSLYIVEDPDRAGHGQITTSSCDFDARRQRSPAAVSSPTRRRDVRVRRPQSAFRDPDGNEVGFGGAPVDTG